MQCVVEIWAIQNFHFFKKVFSLSADNRQDKGWDCSSTSLNNALRNANSLAEDNEMISSQLS